MILLNAARIFFRSILHADEWIIIFPTLFWRRGWILCPFCLMDRCKAARKNVADSLTPQAMARVALVFCHVPAAHQVQFWEDQVEKGLAYTRSIAQELCLSHGGRCHLGHSATCPWDFFFPTVLSPLLPAGSGVPTDESCQAPGVSHSGRVPWEGSQYHTVTTGRGNTVLNSLKTAASQLSVGVHSHAVSLILCSRFCPGRCARKWGWEVMYLTGGVIVGLSRARWGEASPLN